MAAARPGRRAALPQPAYVLQRHDWSESSLILELFTRGQGRVVTVARGAKKPTSNYRPLLLPFQPVLVLLGARAPTPAQATADEGASHDILPLRGVEWAGGQPLLPPAALLGGFYLNELLLKGLARQDPHPRLFDGYAQALAALARAAQAGQDAAASPSGPAPAPTEAAVLRAFELLLLRETGLLPDLAVATLTAQPLRPAERYALDAALGLVSAPEGLPGSRWLALESALQHEAEPARFAALHAAAGEAASPTASPTSAASPSALRRPLQALLHYHFGPAPMRTRDIRQGLLRLQAP